MDLSKTFRLMRAINRNIDSYYPSEQYIDLTLKQVEIMLDIEEIIKPLDIQEQLMMRYRYIDTLIWNEIAEKMKIEVAAAKRRHTKILRKLRSMEC